MQDCKWVWFLLGCMFMAVTFAGCADRFTDHEVEREPRADVRLTMRVKAELIKVLEPAAAAIHVAASVGLKSSET